MAAVHILPSLTLWHQRSISSQYPPNGRVLLWWVTPRCKTAGVVKRHRHHIPRRCTVAVARVDKSDHCAGSFGPSAWDRLLAASVYLWPICEGSWRLAVVFARIVQYQTLDWLVWTNMGAHYKSGDDQAAVQAVTQAAQMLYQEAAVFLKEILHLGTDSPSVLVKHGKIQSFSPTPGHMDSLCSLMYLAAVSCLASAAFSQQRQKQQSRKRQNETLDSEEDIKRSWLRMPQVVMAASCCALLLRMSLVTMQGASGLAKDTYKFVAVSLTLASVCTGMAQVTQVVFGNFEDKQMLLQLTQQASNIAWLHCALSISDWALMLPMPFPWSLKIRVGITVAVTYALVRILQHKALDSNWLFRNS